MLLALAVALFQASTGVIPKLPSLSDLRLSSSAGNTPLSRSVRSIYEFITSPQLIQITSGISGFLAFAASLWLSYLVIPSTLPYFLAWPCCLLIQIGWLSMFTRLTLLLNPSTSATVPTLTHDDDINMPDSQWHTIKRFELPLMLSLLTYTLTQFPGQRFYMQFVVKMVVAFFMIFATITVYAITYHNVWMRIGRRLRSGDKIERD